ncbi:hypothetical protein [Kitasatospora sp. McL0602]|uniref:hypothetical protein n=1 Tax=Kitasatospora sp. McL0602 TaxID=3439530 RepID=UPI003F89ABCB
MEIQDVLDGITELARGWGELAEHSCSRERHRFRRVGDITVTGSLAFTAPSPPEWHEHDTVPRGRYPVFMGVVEEPEPGGAAGRPPSWTSLTVVPLAEPEVIAEALEAGRYEEVYQDYQPFGPEIGVLWGEGAGSRHDLDALEAALAEGEAAGRVPNVVEVVADQETGANLLAFRVWGACDADGVELYAPDGSVVCLVLTTNC